MRRLIKNKAVKSQSMNRKLIVPISLLMMMQGIIFVLSISGVGVMRELTQTSYHDLNTKVDTTRNTLEDYMENRWAKYLNFHEVLRVAKTDYNRIEDETIDVAHPMQISQDMADSLIRLVNNSRATGAFVIYDEPNKSSDKKSALYLRDLEPEMLLIDNADLRLDFGTTELAKEMNITLGNQWQSAIELQENNPNHDFYFQLKKAVEENPQLSTKDLGRWCMPFQLHPGSDKRLAYCLPLLNEDHEMYGVVGIDITIQYFQGLLPYEKLVDGSRGAYVLAMEDTTGSIHTAVTKGPFYSQMILGGDEIFLSTIGDSKEAIYSVKGKKEGTKPVIAAASSFDLYRGNTPFKGEKWVLLGMTWKDSLLIFTSKLRYALFIAFISAMVLGVLGAILISVRFSRPVRVMIRNLRESDPEKEIVLPKLGISEIDELADAVEKLSADVAYSASRLSQIIKMMDMPLGTIEYDKSGGDVFCTLEVGILLNFSEENCRRTRLKRKVFDEEMERFHGAMVRVEQGDVKSKTELFREIRVQVVYSDGDLRWIQFKILENQHTYLAILQDVTEEIQEKLKLEWERDYDSLTNLYNRRSFQEMVIQFLQTKEIDIGAMVMWDLDNLKYINDTYGHDFGDAYIMEAAGVLSSLNLFGVVVARMSGDEFLAFFHGYESKEEIREIVNKIHEELRNTVLPLPGEQSIKIRASAGICWYPMNAQGYEELVRFADFAMYSAKNTRKGEIQEFEKEAFRRDEVLFSGQEDLNRFIEGRMVDFAFQPIVSAVTGEIFAYEALMRPQSQSLKTVGDVMRLAKAQSKMYQIELLTLDGVLEAFLKQKQAFGNAKLFLNSIPNICLSERDYHDFEEKYREDLHRLVIEIIESDRSDTETFSVKKGKTDSWGAQIALDDFGSGYNTECSLLYMSPDYIKLDMSIIQGIDSDENRKNLVSGILAYTKPRQILTIAEGIETKAEMEAVLELGVDLMQGFYLAKPNFEVKDIPDTIKKEILECYEKKMI